MSLPDDLERLRTLRDNGTLDEDEFQRAKARVLGGQSAGDAAGVSALNQLRRSRADRWIGGVCGGIARSSGVDSWIWRLIITVFALFGGAGVILYILLWIFIPEE